MRNSERKYKGVVFRPRMPNQPMPLAYGKGGWPARRKANPAATGDQQSLAAPPRPPSSPVSIGEKRHSAVTLFRQHSASAGVRNDRKGDTTTPPPRRPMLRSTTRRQQRHLRQARSSCQDKRRRCGCTRKSMYSASPWPATAFTAVKLFH